MDRSSAPVDLLCSRNDDVLPYITSLSFDTDTNQVPIQQAADTTDKINDVWRESTSTDLANRCAKISTSQHQKLQIGPSPRHSSDSTVVSRRLKVNQGKSDPNSRKETNAYKHQIATDVGLLPTVNLPARGVQDAQTFDQSPSSIEQEGKRSASAQGNAETTLDGSGVHSIGMSSDDEQQSLVSVLANMNAEVWTENEESPSKFLK